MEFSGVQLYSSTHSCVTVPYIIRNSSSLTQTLCCRALELYRCWNEYRLGFGSNNTPDHARPCKGVSEKTKWKIAKPEPTHLFLGCSPNA